MIVDALRTLVGSPEFRSLDDMYQKFCPFEALGMVRTEIRHGNFLGYLLNPVKPHGFGDLCLEAFLGLVVAPTVDTSAPRLVGADVRREWRNIDLVVVLPAIRTIIAVELKIDASQGHDQLARYRRIVEREWPEWKHCFVFLTKNGEAALDDWDELNMTTFIAALEKVGEAVPDAPAAVSLKQYCGMTRRHHLGDPVSIELARRLWAEHSEALEFLIRQRREQPLQSILDTIGDRAEEFAEAASLPRLRIVTDDAQDDIVRFAVEQWDELPGFRDGTGWTDSGRVMLIEIKPIGRGRIAAFVYTGPTTTPALRTELTNRLTVATATRKKVLPTSKHARLAEMTLFEVDDPFNIDERAAVEAIASSFSLFVSTVISSFDKALRDADAKMAT